MNKRPDIENYIEINEKDVLLESLPDEKRREYAVLIQDRMMESVGFKRASSNA